MTGKDGLENQKNINKELSASEKALLEAARLSAQLTEEGRSLTTELKDQLGIRSKTNEGEKTLLSLSRQITKSAQENKVELRNSEDITKQIKKETEQLGSAKREQLILEKTVGNQTDKNKKTAKQNATLITNQNKVRLLQERKIEETKNKIANASGKDLSKAQSLLKNQENAKEVMDGNLQKLLKVSSAEAQRLALSNQVVSAAEENLDVSNEQSESQNRINRGLGISGGALKTINKIAGGFASSLGMEDVLKAMKESAAEQEDLNKKVSRFQTFAVGVTKAFENVGKSLTDPVTIVGALIKGFTDVDKEATDFARQTGQEINTITTSIDSLNMGYVNMADYIRAASTVTKELGMNAANIFSKEDILEVAQITDEIGLAGKEAANLAKFSKLNGTSIESQNKALDKGRIKFNAQNKTAFDNTKILKDIANTSNSIAVSYAGYPGKLGEAATAAANLGLNLEGVDKIASSLLDFESSISAELAAEVITGKALNLEKARQAALDNDLATLGKEISKNIGTSADFAKMNRKEQEALAKAVGMTKDELAGSLINQEIGKTISEDQLTAAQKQQYEASKNREAQDRIAKSVAKIGQAFAPIVEFVADILATSWGIYGLMGTALLFRIKAVSKAVGGISKGFSAAIKGVKGLASGIGNVFKGKGVGRLKAFGRQSQMEGASESTKLGNKTKQGAGKGIKDNLKGLAEGLKEMGAGKILKGIFNLAAFGVASVPAMASIPFLLFIGLTPLKQIQSNMESLAGGLRSMGEGTLKGSLALAAFGLAAIPSIASIPFLLTFGTIPLKQLTTNFLSLASGLIDMSGTMAGSLALGVFSVAAIPSIASLPFLLSFGTIPMKQLSFNFINLAAGLTSMSGTMMGSLALGAFGLAATLAIPSLVFLGGIALLGVVGAAGLMALGGGLEGLGLIAATGLPFLGIALIAALGGAMIPFGYALNLAAPAIKAFGSVILSVFQGLGVVITAVSEGFTNMFGALNSDNISGLLILGPALLGISAGLAAMGITGLLAMPTIFALTALGAVSEGLSSIFGGNNDEESTTLTKNNEMAGVEKKLDTLISLISEGGDVYIDGAKVGKSLQLASSKVG